MSSLFFFVFFFHITEAAVCVSACTVVYVCSSLCPPQFPVAVGAKPLHQCPVCLSAQRQGKNPCFPCVPASLQHVSIKSCSLHVEINYNQTFEVALWCLMCLWLIPQVHYNVGKNLADRGNSTAAIRYYREAIRYVSSQALAFKSTTNK